MKIKNLRTIQGPNVFHNRPVLIMTVALEEYTEVASTDLPGFTELIQEYLPGIVDHHCSPGRRGGFIERLQRGTYMGHIIEHIALEMSTLAGIEVSYGKTVYAGEDGLYNIVVRFKSEEAMKFLLKAAFEMAGAVARGEKDYPLALKIEEAKEIAAEFELGPSTRAIVDAAERRGIPWMRLNDLNLIQFGYGKFRKLIQATTTSMTGDIAVDIAQDKELTKKLLASAEIRVPRGMSASNQLEVLEAFEELGAPVALKPVDGNHGKGVCLNLQTAAEVIAAYESACKFNGKVLVEQYMAGKDFRVLIVGGKMSAASERVPAHVFGDGRSTVRELIEAENCNPLRGEGHEKPMTKIHINGETLKQLARVGFSLESVPKFRELVYLKATANLSTGGTASDVTDLVHPEIKMMCERAARMIGLDICGVDLIAKDISAPAERQAGIIEVNAGPGIRMHVYPSKGKSRDVGGAIVDMMYPNHHDGRIPITAITGTNGKTTVTRLVSFVLQRAGRTVGTTTTGGIYVGGVKVAGGDTTGPVSARTILSDSQVDVAVLETARGGIVKRGLGFDWCDVGVITNIREDHIGQDGIENIGDILRIKSLIAERVREGGTLIFNADDINLTALAEKLSESGTQRNLIYFSLDKNNDVLRAHTAKGGTAYFHDSGWLVESRDGVERRLIHSSEIPLTLFGTAEFQIANVLAVIAASVTNGAPYDILFAALKEFRSNEHNSGRANLYKIGRGYAILDYGHNPDAFKSICAMTARWSNKITTGVVGIPGDRSDKVIIEAAKAAAHGFDRIYLRDDIDLRGRAPGEAVEIFRRAVLKETDKVECRVILDEAVAMKEALRDVKEGEVVVLFYDEMPYAEKTILELGAKPLDSFESMNLFAEQIRPMERKHLNVPMEQAKKQNAQVEFAR